MFLGRLFLISRVVQQPLKQKFSSKSLILTNFSNFGFFSKYFPSLYFEQLCRYGFIYDRQNVNKTYYQSRSQRLYVQYGFSNIDFHFPMVCPNKCDMYKKENILFASKCFKRTKIP